MIILQENIFFGKVKYKHVIEANYLNNCIISPNLKLESILLGSVGGDDLIKDWF